MINEKMQQCRNQVKFFKMEGEVKKKNQKKGVKSGNVKKEILKRK